MKDPPGRQQTGRSPQRVWGKIAVIEFGLIHITAFYLPVLLFEFTQVTIQIKSMLQYNLYRKAEWQTKSMLSLSGLNNPTKWQSA